MRLSRDKRQEESATKSKAEVQEQEQNHLEPRVGGGGTSDAAGVPAPHCHTRSRRCHPCSRPRPHPPPKQGEPGPHALLLTLPTVVKSTLPDRTPRSPSFAATATPRGDKTGRLVSLQSQESTCHWKTPAGTDMTRESGQCSSHTTAPCPPYRREHREVGPTLGTPTVWGPACPR